MCVNKYLKRKGTFTIGVDYATGNMTAEQIKAAMTFESPTNPDFAGIEVAGSGGHFTISDMFFTISLPRNIMSLFEV